MRKLTLCNLFLFARGRPIERKSVIQGAQQCAPSVCNFLLIHTVHSLSHSVAPIGGSASSSSRRVMSISTSSCTGFETQAVQTEATKCPHTTKGSRSRSVTQARFNTQ
eukprot:3902987-Amphidinium_carterae.1